ncbi:MAG: rhomboid family intramembrane serine protease [Kofleriaceae bacterium]
MIIPVGHDQSIRRLPWVTIAIVAICFVVQIWQQVDPHARVIVRFGYQTGSGLNEKLITSAFVHGGWFHLVGNMLFLVLAATVLEDRWGRIKFGVFYLAGAIASTLVFDALYHGPVTFLVGASGAISATMGAFLIYYARTQITFWYWLTFRTGTFKMAAYFALPLWLAEQFLSLYLQPDSGIAVVAYSAHIGGFAFGAAAALVGNMVFGKRDHEGEVEAPAPAAPTFDDDRYAKTVKAIHRGDPDVRALASRMVLELGRVGDHATIVKLCGEMGGRIVLTEPAFVAALAAANHEQKSSLYVALATAFDREVPTSAQLPEVLWRTVQLHRDGRRSDDMFATLQAIADRFPDTPFGIKAKALLEQQAARASL